jgi:hypothetical protein
MNGQYRNPGHRPRGELLAIQSANESLSATQSNPKLKRYLAPGVGYLYSPFCIAQVIWPGSPRGPRSMFGRRQVHPQGKPLNDYLPFIYCSGGVFAEDSCQRRRSFGCSRTWGVWKIALQKHVWKNTDRNTERLYGTKGVGI